MLFELQKPKGIICGLCSQIECVNNIGVNSNSRDVSKSVRIIILLLSQIKYVPEINVIKQAFFYFLKNITFVAEL